MKKPIIAIIGVLAIVSLSSFFGFLFENSFSPKRKIAYKIVNEIEKKFKTKYGLYCVGISEEAPDGKYISIGLDLDYYHKILSKDEGRVLLLNCVYDALGTFNSYPQFREHMANVPFKENNIIINIYVHPPESYEVYYPNIGVFSCFLDKLRYKTDIPNNPNPYEYYTEERESLEEAQKIVDAQSRGELPFHRG